MRGKNPPIKKSLMKGRKRTVKKLAALVLVLILCFSVSIGGTYAAQLGQSGMLASDFFVAEGSTGVSITVAEGAKIKLLPGSPVGGDAVCITADADDATVTLEFTVPKTFDGKPLVAVSSNGDWDQNSDGTFTKTIHANENVYLSDFEFTMDSRVDVVDGKVCTVVGGEVKEIDWNGLEKGYIRIDTVSSIQN